MIGENLSTNVVRRIQAGHPREDDWARVDGFVRPRITALGRRYFLSKDDADDLCQEVMLKLFKKICMYETEERGGGSFRPWLMRCAVNKALEFLRQRRADLAAGKGGTDVQQHILQIPSPATESQPQFEEGEEALEYLLREVLPDLLCLAHEHAVHIYGADIVDKVCEIVAATSWDAFLLFEILRFEAKEVGPLLNNSVAAIHRSILFQRSKSSDEEIIAPILKKSVFAIHRSVSRVRARIDQECDRLKSLREDSAEESR